jgi:hypothetical protein
VLKGGPAQEAGVKEGDRVLSVNGVNIAGESHEFALAAFGLSMDGEVCMGACGGRAGGWGSGRSLAHLLAAGLR